MKIKDEYSVKWCVWKKQSDGRFKPSKLFKTKKEAMTKSTRKDSVSRLVVWSK